MTEQAACHWRWHGSSEAERLVLRIHCHENHGGITPKTKRVIEELALQNIPPEECSITDCLWKPDKKKEEN